MIQRFLQLFRSMKASAYAGTVSFSLIEEFSLSGYLPHVD